MKIKGYVICQAVRKEFEGIKAESFWRAGLVFQDKEDAYNYLASVIKNRKREIKLGDRESWNLDPDKCLDFCISEAEIIIDDNKMLLKSWKLK
jgi:hypothetical protein